MITNEKIYPIAKQFVNTKKDDPFGIKTEALQYITLQNDYIIASNSIYLAAFKNPKGKIQKDCLIHPKTYEQIEEEHKIPSFLRIIPTEDKILWKRKWNKKELNELMQIIKEILLKKGDIIRFEFANNSITDIKNNEVHPFSFSTEEMGLLFIYVNVNYLKKIITNVVKTMKLYGDKETDFRYYGERMPFSFQNDTSEYCILLCPVAMPKHE